VIAHVIYWALLVPLAASAWYSWRRARTLARTSGELLSFIRRVIDGHLTGSVQIDMRQELDVILHDHLSERVR
jgi:hypothetical protein